MERPTVHHHQPASLQAWEWPQQKPCAARCGWQIDRDPSSRGHGGKDYLSIASQGFWTDSVKHIHNLVISAVVWKGHDLYVSTNSIDKATFARNCMLSRLQYKGLKIEWYSDECAEPLPKAEARPMPISRASAPVAKPVAVPNRFDLLSLGDDNDSSKASEADDASRLSGIPLRRSMDTSNAAA